MKLKSVLILEDDEGIRETLRECCQEHCELIHESSTVSEALTLLDGNTYDVAIIDVALGQEDAATLLALQSRSEFPRSMLETSPGGLKLLNHLTGRHSRTQRIIISAYGVSKMFGPATIQAGGWYFVSKNPAAQFKPNLDRILFKITAQSLQANMGIFHAGGAGYTNAERQKLLCPRCGHREIAETIQGQMLDMFVCLECDTVFDVIRDTATGALWISTSYLA